MRPVSFATIDPHHQLGRNPIGSPECRLSQPLRPKPGSKEAAKHVLALTEKQLGGLLKQGDFVEVKADEQEVS